MIDVAKLPKAVTTPNVCEDAQDFYKLFLSQIATLPPEERDHYANGVRIIMHEYLALVLSGKLKPYKDKIGKRAKKDFRELIHAINEVLVESGVPMKEEDGKIILDLDFITGRSLRGEG